MLGPVEFDVRVPVAPEGLVSNVQHALSLRLPELRDFEYPRADALNIVASGPSSEHAPLNETCVSLNGSLRLFNQRGIAPDFWAGCDPQAMVADFLTDAPKGTTYLVASKCHPAVFEALQGHEVVVWHVHDDATWDLLSDRFPVSRAVSITICAFELMARVGFRKFDTWGWDGCFMDGQGYFVPQPFNPAKIDVDVGGVHTFPTTPTWALEAQDALTALRGFPFPIHIHGGGMTGEILSMLNPSRFTTDTR